MSRKATILVVDREKILIDLLTRSLTSNELAALGTTSVEEAGRLLELHQPDLVVVDGELTDGFTFIQHILKGKLSRALVLTSTSDMANRAQAMGAADTVARDAGLDALARSIHDILGSELQMPGQGGIRLLIADDEEQLRSVLSDFLSPKGYVLTTASNGQEAVERVAEDPTLQVALLDVSMPVMGGIEALTRIMALEPHPSVLMMTAVADREVARQALTIGAFDYILKPFNFAGIESSIEAALSRREFQKQPWWKRLTNR